MQPEKVSRKKWLITLVILAVILFITINASNTSQEAIRSEKILI